MVKKGDWPKKGGLDLASQKCGCPQTSLANYVPTVNCVKPNRQTKMKPISMRKPKKIREFVDGTGSRWQRGFGVSNATVFSTYFGCLSVLGTKLLRLSRSKPDDFLGLRSALRRDRIL